MKADEQVLRIHFANFQVRVGWRGNEQAISPQEQLKVSATGGIRNYAGRGQAWAKTGLKTLKGVLVPHQVPTPTTTPRGSEGRGEVPNKIRTHKGFTTKTSSSQNARSWAFTMQVRETTCSERKEPQVWSWFGHPDTRWWACWSFQLFF